MVMMNDRDKSLEGEDRMHERMEASSPSLYSFTRKRMMAPSGPKVEVWGFKNWVRGLPW